MLNFFGVFCLSLLLGFVPRIAFGEISENARTFLHAPFVLVFGFGYTGWAARLHALGMKFLGRGIFKALVQIILFRRKPRSLAEVLRIRTS